MNRLSLILSTLLISGAALAQDMQIDLLVFRSGPLPADSAFWVSSPAIPPCDAVTLQPEGGLVAAFSRGQQGCRPRAGRGAATGGINLLRESLLATHAARLRQNQYAVLASQSWRQSVPEGVPVMIRSGSPDAGVPLIEGTLTVSGDARAAEIGLALNLLYRDGTGTSRHAVLQETRPVKPGEIHYFDHPLFGALVLVSFP